MGYVKDRISKKSMEIFYQKGLERERLLKEALNNIGLQTVDASRHQDRHEHWDFKIQMDLKIDVKGVKDNDDAYHYIELKNVEGKKGWLYGDADLIAFETSRFWILVETKTLQDYVAEVCKDKVMATVAKEAIYRLYNRKNTADLITRLPTLDLMAIAFKILNK
jgi:hypothetical protein